MQEFARLGGEIKMLNVVASGGVALRGGFDQAMKDLVRWAASLSERAFRRLNALIPRVQAGLRHPGLLRLQSALIFG